MAVTQCPICKEFLVGYKWTKTKTGKNWLADKDNKWHDCPNKKFSKKTASKSKKLFNKNGPTLFPETYDAEITGFYCRKGHYQGPYKQIPKYCDVCTTPTGILEYRYCN